MRIQNLEIDFYNDSIDITVQGEEDIDTDTDWHDELPYALSNKAVEDGKVAKKGDLVAIEILLPKESVPKIIDHLKKHPINILYNAPELGLSQVPLEVVVEKAYEKYVLRKSA